MPPASESIRVIAVPAESLSSCENFIDLGGQLEIQIADALYAVGIQIDYHFVPHVEPLRMVIHRFGNQCHTSHIAEGSDEVFTFERTVQLAVLESPALRAWQLLLYFRIGEFLCSRHKTFSSILAGGKRSWALSLTTADIDGPRNASCVFSWYGFPQVLRDYGHRLQHFRTELDFSLDGRAATRFFATNSARKDLPGILRLNLHQRSSGSALTHSQLPGGRPTQHNPVAAGRAQ